MKLLNIIAAISENNVIGSNNDLPWPRFSADMKLFREATTGHAIIMGRKTFDSFGRSPLKNRTNIVISRTPQPQTPGVVWAGNLDDAIELGYQTSDTPFVIGGAQIYGEAMYKADIAFISHIHGIYHGDVKFPPVDFTQYRVIDEKEFPEFTFRKYRLR